MTPSEFNYALKDWKELSDSDLKSSYERTRIQAYWTLISTASKTISFKEFCQTYMPFEWDNENDNRAAHDIEEFTMEEYDMMASLTPKESKEATWEDLKNLV